MLIATSCTIEPLQNGSPCFTSLCASFNRASSQIRQHSYESFFHWPQTFWKALACQQEAQTFKWVILGGSDILFCYLALEDLLRYDSQGMIMSLQLCACLLMFRFCAFFWKAIHKVQCPERAIQNQQIIFFAWSHKHNRIEVLLTGVISVSLCLEHMEHMNGRWTDELWCQNLWMVWYHWTKFCNDRLHNKFSLSTHWIQQLDQ